MSTKLTDNLVFLDVETTGFTPTEHRIVEVGILKVVNGELVKTYSTLVNPEVEVHPSVLKFLRVEREEIDSAPSFAQILPEVQSLLDWSLFIAHNVDFDYQFMRGEYGRLQQNFNMPSLCTVQLSKAFFSSFLSHSLDSVCQRHNIKIVNRHRAFDDAQALWEFNQALEKQFGAEAVLQKVQDLHTPAKAEKSSTVAKEQQSLF